MKAWICVYIYIYIYSCFYIYKKYIFKDQRSSRTINFNRTFTDTNPGNENDYIPMKTIFTINAATQDYIAVRGEFVISRTLYFLGNTNELRNFSLTTQQRKFFICSFEYGLLLVLQDSWCLGLLVLETKWLSGMLRWQRVVGRVRDVFKVTV